MSEAASQILSDQCDLIRIFMNEPLTPNKAYFQDWNALMRVVDKIEDRGNMITIGYKYCIIRDHIGLTLSSEVRDTKKWAVFHAVYSFIKKIQLTPLTT
jgi:hypothetical protein